MAVDNKSRESHFPAIEKKHGKPMAHWHRVMKKLEGKKYAEQVAHLRDEHGFSQAHANALVMYSRGSASAQRIATPDAYFDALPDEQATTMRAIFATICTRHPQLDLVIAWNQPMLKLGNGYVFGASAAKKHILLAPWGHDALEKIRSVSGEYTVNKKTIRVPINWSIDAGLLDVLVTRRIKELGGKRPRS